MQVILHVGPVKTGSTSLQTFFRESFERLRERGIHYPPQFFQSGKLPFRTFCGSDEQKKNAFRRELATQVRLMRKMGLHTLLISSEQLVSQWKTQDDIEAVRDLFGDFFNRYSIICTVRHQTEILNGMISESARSGQSLPQDSYDDLELPEWLRYREFADRVQTVFPNALTLIPYSGSLMKTVASGLGLNVDAEEAFSKDPIWKRRTLDSWSIDLLRTAERQHGFPAKAIIDSLLVDYKPRKEWLFSEQTHRAICSYYEDDNASLLAKWPYLQQALEVKSYADLAAESQDGSILKLENVLPLVTEFHRSEYLRYLREFEVLRLSGAEEKIIPRIRLLMRTRSILSELDDGFLQQHKNLERKILQGERIPD